MAKAEVPDGLIGMTVAEAQNALPAGLDLGLCKTATQPKPWFTNIDANASKEVVDYHEDTEPKTRLVIPGTVGVVINGIIEPDDRKGRGATGTAGGVVVNVNILVGADGSVEING